MNHTADFRGGEFEGFSILKEVVCNETFVLQDWKEL